MSDDQTRPLPPQPPYPSTFPSGSAYGPEDGSGYEVPPARRRLRGPVALLAAVAVVAGVVGAGAAVGIEQLTGESGAVAGATGSARGSNASSTAGSVSDVAAKVSPSVVEIEAASGTGESTGSGVVISEDGEILTNHHVVAGADRVKLTFSDGRTATADVVGTSPDHDLALVRTADAGDLTPAKLGDSDSVGVGEQVVAIGSPGGLSGTVTSGIVSAKDRPVTVEKSEGGGAPEDWPFQFGRQQYNGEVGGETTTYKAIQTDAALNPGNSGGALVDLDGNIVGINSAMYSPASGSGAGTGGSGGGSGSVGLGFAIPVNDVKDLLGDLRSGDGGAA
ncbi:trypsin-like peptidase domain-containing protein [Streptomyces sp. HNM0574]|uniref:S1C family serine protease n=1 Tax=Streptomyces sp. HNM0574 TaxID=2714954 RepID=UPI00146CC980|nr:trypsin-like peptidase domain-containing protein [Streptomyces sp. HNM0574]NLU68022.1 trypsin-like serine protease [Streptomyces sp. HNM0574]